MTNILKPKVLKEFKLSARVTIKRAELDPRLPDIIGPKEWYKLAPWSNLKHPKRWVRNKRLQKKFCKHRRRYLPNWIFELYLTIGEQRVEHAYARATKQIMDEEDKRILDLCSKGNPVTVTLDNKIVGEIKSCDTTTGKITATITDSDAIALVKDGIVPNVSMGCNTGRFPSTILNVATEAKEGTPSDLSIPCAGCGKMTEFRKPYNVDEQLCDECVNFMQEPE